MDAQAYTSTPRSYHTTDHDEYMTTDQHDANGGPIFHVIFQGV